MGDKALGLALGVRQDVEDAELQALAEALQDPEALQRLRLQLRQACQKEYRKVS